MNSWNSTRWLKILMLLSKQKYHKTFLVPIKSTREMVQIRCLANTYDYQIPVNLLNKANANCRLMYHLITSVTNLRDNDCLELIAGILWMWKEVPEYLHSVFSKWEVKSLDFRLFMCLFWCYCPWCRTSITVGLTDGTTGQQCAIALFRAGLMPGDSWFSDLLVRIQVK